MSERTGKLSWERLYTNALPSGISVLPFVRLADWKAGLCWGRERTCQLCCNQMPKVPFWPAGSSCTWRGSWWFEFSARSSPCKYLKTRANAPGLVASLNTRMRPCDNSITRNRESGFSGCLGFRHKNLPKDTIFLKCWVLLSMKPWAGCMSLSNLCKLSQPFFPLTVNGVINTGLIRLHWGQKESDTNDQHPV